MQLDRLETIEKLQVKSDDISDLAKSAKFSCKKYLLFLFSFDIGAW